MNELEKKIRSFSEEEFARVSVLVRESAGFLGTGTRDATAVNASVWRRFYVPDSFYGHRLAAGVSILSDYVGCGQPDIFTTDAWGVNRNEVSGDESAVRVRVARERGHVVLAVLGGSTVQGVGARSPQFTIPALLEHILSERLGVGAKCLNHGVAGWSSADQLHLLLHGIEYRPDVCIFYDGWNCCWNFYQAALLGSGLADGRQLGETIDWRRAVSPRHLEHEETNRLAFSASGLLRRAAWLLGHHALAGMLWPLDLFCKRGSSQLAGRLLPIRPYDPLVRAREVELDLAERDRLIKATAEEYLRIHALAEAVCRKRGIKFIHFLQPLLVNSQKIRTPAEEGFLRREGLMRNPEIFSLFPECVRQIDPGGGVINLSAVFDGIDDDVFLDGGHLNPYGNFLVADLIARELVTAGVVRPHAVSSS